MPVLKQVRWLGLVLVILGSCTRIFDPAFVEDLLYRQYVRDGWEAFAYRDYQYAIERFSRAAAKDSLRGDAFAGLGWTYLMLENFPAADFNFARCARNPDSSYWGYAGWAFLKSVQDSFTVSNHYLRIVIEQVPTWHFPHGLFLRVSHLWALMAHNYFLLGDYNNSLQAIRKVNPSFSANVETPEGLTALALEIEKWLQHVSKQVRGLPRAEFSRFTP